MKRKTIGALFIALSITIAGNACAQGKDGLGIGVIVGEPTGLSLKNWITGTRALAAGIAWSFSDNASLHLHGDYLVHRFDRVSVPELKGALPLYYGLGARIKFKEDNRGRGRNKDDALIGIRFPLGISYLFADASIDLFAEIVPVLDVAPDTDFGFNAALGARWYFGK